jgi:SAM-dependent methyltransferase
MIEQMPEVPRINDASFVSAEYTDATRLAARAAFWQACQAPQPQDVALQRVRELAPTAVLEVGCGQGAFAAALAEAGIDVVATDQSAQMVELTAVRGVTARQADIQDLPFGDSSFDCVVANYMLYHVPDLPRALDEVARVLRPGGVFVAVTNSRQKIGEMWDLVGRAPDLDGAEAAFGRENGTELLERHFETVTRLDVNEPFTVSADAIRNYIRATRFAALAENVPELPDGLTVTAAGSVFISTKQRNSGH